MMDSKPEKYADALEWAFDMVKAAVDAADVGLRRDRQVEDAQLVVGLAIAVELRKLRALWGPGADDGK